MRSKNYAPVTTESMLGLSDPVSSGKADHFIVNTIAAPNNATGIYFTLSNTINIPHIVSAYWLSVFRTGKIPSPSIQSSPYPS
uniref:Uncharacterized protein n=1 Tax=Glossina brevipalpis TaxID=37001 RepID=A0A1A9WZJ2_9MUSC